MKLNICTSVLASLLCIVVTLSIIYSVYITTYDDINNRVIIDLDKKIKQNIYSECKIIYSSLDILYDICVKEHMKLVGIETKDKNIHVYKICDTDVSCYAGFNNIPIDIIKSTNFNHNSKIFKIYVNSNQTIYYSIHYQQDTKLSLYEHKNSLLLNTNTDIEYSMTIIAYNISDKENNLNIFEIIQNDILEFYNPNYHLSMNKHSYNKYIVNINNKYILVDNYIDTNLEEIAIKCEYGYYLYYNFYMTNIHFICNINYITNDNKLNINSLLLYIYHENILLSVYNIKYKEQWNYLEQIISNNIDIDAELVDSQLQVKMYI